MEPSTPASIETTPTTVPRPTAITVICIIGFIGVLFTIPLIFTDIARNIGTWYPPYLAFSAVVGFVCMAFCLTYSFLPKFMHVDFAAEFV